MNDNITFEVTLTRAEWEMVCEEFTNSLSQHLLAKAKLAIGEATHSVTPPPPPIKVGDTVRYGLLRWSADHPGLVVIDIQGDQAMCRSLRSNDWVRYPLRDLRHYEADR